MGQRGFEEVDRITEPGNFGWNTREGFVCYPSGGDECPSEGLIDPIHVYPRAVGRSITGGVVYRGTELAELWGAYLFADFVGGQVWTLRERAEAEPEVEEILRAGNVASFGYDSRGEVLIVTFDRGILRLGRGEGGSVPELPERLSETGCFTDLASYTVAPGVIPYQLNVPFWSDGLDKIRHVALPAGESATPSEDGEYDFPVGTLFLKTFHYPDATTGESRRLETRIYARQTSGWRGFTWRWNEEQTDAILVRGSQTETIDIGSGPQTWLYPSSAQCDQCHTSAAGSVLGFNTRQLNRGVNPAGGGYPQLLAFEEAGLLADLPSGSPLSEVGELPRHPRLDDGDAPTGERARAWLDTNCAMCHRADSALGGAFDLRASVPFSEMAICDVPPTRGDLGITDARLLSPGSPTQSLIRERAGRRGEEQMPPLASHVVPSQGVDLLNEWISALSGCP